ncbi:MAG: hypothetical protein WCP07_11650 [bacterium]
MDSGFPEMARTIASVNTKQKDRRKRLTLSAALLSNSFAILRNSGFGPLAA